MAVDFKSHVLRRDEKGLFGIPFKRLLGAGVGGGLAYTVLQMVVPAYAIPFGVVLAFCIITLTAQRGGIALWERLLFRIRGRLLIIASTYPNSLIAQVVDLLDLPPDLVQLDGTSVFSPPHAHHDIDLREWITFAHAGERDGLTFVDSPMKEGLHD
jgi:hypothetical protein